MKPPLKILVTAGNTMTLIDQVRAITNVFSGRTGAAIAQTAAGRGHAVTLLTSRPEAVSELPEFSDRAAGDAAAGRLAIEPYRTFADLQSAMEKHVRHGQFDAVIHSAAVSDYECAGVYSPSPGTTFDASACAFAADGSQSPSMIDRRAGKIRSGQPELWLRLIPTIKLVDQIRQPWGFRGILTKFKLEVAIAADELQSIAEASRHQSGADLMVANTFEEMAVWALVGPVEGRYHRVERVKLATHLIDEIERRAASQEPAAK